MPAAKSFPAAARTARPSMSAAGPAWRRLASSPNRRRAVLRVGVWALFTGWATVVIPFFVL